MICAIARIVSSHRHKMVGNMNCSDTAILQMGNQSAVGNRSIILTVNFKSIGTAKTGLHIIIKCLSVQATVTRLI